MRACVRACVRVCVCACFGLISPRHLRTLISLIRIVAGQTDRAHSCVNREEKLKSPPPPPLINQTVSMHVKRQRINWSDEPAWPSGNALGW